LIVAVTDQCQHCYDLYFHLSIKIVTSDTDSDCDISVISMTAFCFSKNCAISIVINLLFHSFQYSFYLIDLKFCHSAYWFIIVEVSKFSNKTENLNFKQSLKAKTGQTQCSYPITWRKLDSCVFWCFYVKFFCSHAATKNIDFYAT